MHKVRLWNSNKTLNCRPPRKPGREDGPHSQSTCAHKTSPFQYQSNSSFTEKPIVLTISLLNSAFPAVHWSLAPSFCHTVASAFWPDTPISSYPQCSGKKNKWILVPTLPCHPGISMKGQAVHYLLPSCSPMVILHCYGVMSSSGDHVTRKYSTVCILFSSAHPVRSSRKDYTHDKGAFEQS